MQNNKVLLISIQPLPFIDKDIEILERNGFRVNCFYSGPEKGLRFFINHTRLLFWLLMNIRGASAVVIWFVDYHALLPAIFGKIFGKKVIEVIAGFDAVSIPVIKFGIFFKNNARAWIARKSYQLADNILPVHDSLKKGTNYYADPSGTGYKIGVLNFVKNVKAQFLTLPFIYDTNFWRHYDEEPQSKAVITTATVGDMRTAQRKGLDLLFEVAQEMPEITFSVIGVKDSIYDSLRADAPANVELIRYIPQHEMPKKLSRHKVYTQLSLSEGLPNALGEAMLCECIPVGSDVNGIPDTIGDAGFILKENSRKKAIELIRKALDSDPLLGKKARERILKNYPSDSREKRFIALLKE